MDDEFSTVIWRSIEERSADGVVLDHPCGEVCRLCRCVGIQLDLAHEMLFNKAQALMDEIDDKDSEIKRLERRISDLRGELESCRQ